MDLEQDFEKRLHEEKIEKSKEVDNAIDYLKQTFWLYAHDKEKYNFTQEEYRDAVLGDLETLKHFVIRYNGEYGYDETDDFNYSWTLAKSLLFTVTIMTTVGYGHISPVTKAGRLFCIAYALIGMPLLLVFMKDIGDLMADGVRYLYSRMCCRWCRVRRRDAELPPGVDRKSKSIMHDEVGKEAYMPTDLVMVPIMVNLVIIFLFLFVGAAIFSAWEDWNLGPALYFCFITLTTIGFGDMVPEKTFVEATQSFVGVLKMSFCVTYCIFGIMLITLGLNLMQEQVMEKVRWVASSIGMGENGPGDEELVKVTKMDRLKQTPIDLTGNELDFNERRRVAGQWPKSSAEEEDEINEQANMFGAFSSAHSSRASTAKSSRASTASSRA